MSITFLNFVLQVIFLSAHTFIEGLALLRIRLSSHHATRLLHKSLEPGHRRPPAQPGRLRGRSRNHRRGGRPPAGRGGGRVAGFFERVRLRTSFLAERDRGQPAPQSLGPCATCRGRTPEATAGAARSAKANAWPNCARGGSTGCATPAHPLQEKLTLFWHGHFATSMEKVRSSYCMYRQNQTFRAHAAGHWPTWWRRWPGPRHADLPGQRAEPGGSPTRISPAS
jgi:hypothetical protein